MKTHTRAHKWMFCSMEFETRLSFGVRFWQFEIRRTKSWAHHWTQEAWGLTVPVVDPLLWGLRPGRTEPSQNRDAAVPSSVVSRPYTCSAKGKVLEHSTSCVTKTCCTPSTPTPLDHHTNTWCTCIHCTLVSVPQKILKSPPNQPCVVWVKPPSVHRFWDHGWIDRPNGMKPFSCSVLFSSWYFSFLLTAQAEVPFHSMNLLLPCFGNLPAMYWHCMCTGWPGEKCW